MQHGLRFFHPVLRASALKARPRRVTIGGEHFVLFRDRDGRPGALVDRCPHRFAPLSKGRVLHDGRLACPYHGWRFDTQGRGESPSQPTLKKCDVQALRIVERFGHLFIARADTPEEAFPALGWEGFEHAGTFSMQMPAPLHVMLDNFSEDEHTPWVHTRLGWNEAGVQTIDFEAENHDDRTEVRYKALQRPSRWTTVLGLKPGDIFHNEWMTRFDPVRTQYDIYWTCPTSGKVRPVVTRSVIFMVPETDTSTRFFVFVFAKINSRMMRAVRGLVHRAAVGLAWWEIRDDSVFVPTVADTPTTMRGMRLGKFDKPLIHNRKLLERIYRGNREGADAQVDDLADASTGHAQA